MQAAELRKRARFWRKELNISHWRLSIRFVDKDSSELGNNHALIQLATEYNAAKLWIWIGSPFVEYWLVHELGHIVLAGLRTTCDYSVTEEQAINAYTRALCRARNIACPHFEAL